MAAFVPPSAPARFQPDVLAQGLAARLPQSPPEGGGHDDYHFDSAPPSATPAQPQGGTILGGTRAAVLVPIVLRAEPVLLFTRRTETLARHSGQVSFPGGRVEPSDLSPLQTALRETAEETGIAAASVRVAGYLPRYLTGTGFDIQPVVGVLAPDFVLRPDPAEVAEIFEAPLAFFADPANRRRETRMWNGHQRSFYIYRHDGHEIWGATAAVIVDLVTRLDDMSR